MLFICIYLCIIHESVYPITKKELRAKEDWNKTAETNQTKRTNRSEAIETNKAKRTNRLNELRRNKATARVAMFTSDESSEADWKD